MTEDVKGDGLLSYASSGGSLDILDELLKGCLTTSPQNGNWSPLHWACRAGKSDIVERLIKEGFRSESVTVSQSEGSWDPVSIAIFHGNEKMLDELSAHCRSELFRGVDAVQSAGKRHGGYSCDGCFHVSQ